MQVAAALFGGAALRRPYPYKAGHATHTIVSYLDLTECLTAYSSLVVWSKISDPCVAERRCKRSLAVRGPDRGGLRPAFGAAVWMDK